MALEGLSYEVTYRLVLFAAMLARHGQLGLAEIEGKRDWTLPPGAVAGAELASLMRMPARHPFNPLALLRLAWACARVGTPSRYQCEPSSRDVWTTGADAEDAGRLSTLLRNWRPCTTWRPMPSNSACVPRPTRRWRPVRRAHLRRGRPPVLGPGCAAHAARPFDGRTRRWTHSGTRRKRGARRPADNIPPQASRAIAKQGSSGWADFVPPSQPRQEHGLRPEPA